MPIQPSSQTSPNTCPRNYHNQEQHHKKKEQRLQARDEAAFSDWIESDKIGNYEKFCEGFSGKLNDTWISVTKDDCAIFVNLNCDVQPKITVAFKVKSNLTVVAWYDNTPLDQKNLQWLLGSENKCDLWSKFESLLSHLGAYEEVCHYERQTDILCFFDQTNS